MQTMKVMILTVFANLQYWPDINIFTVHFLKLHNRKQSHSIHFSPMCWHTYKMTRKTWRCHESSLSMIVYVFYIAATIMPPFALLLTIIVSDFLFLLFCRWKLHDVLLAFHLHMTAVHQRNNKRGSHMKCDVPQDS